MQTHIKVGLLLMSAGPIAAFIGTRFAAAGYDSVAGLLIMGGLLIGPFLFYAGYQALRGRIDLDLTGFPGPWREWAFGLFYIAWMIGGTVLLIWLAYMGVNLIRPGTSLYPIPVVLPGLLIVFVLVAWLVRKGYLGPIFLVYLLGLYVVAGVLFATNTMGYGAIAAVVAVLLYRAVMRVRQDGPTFLQRGREALAIVTNQPTANEPADAGMSQSAKGERL